MQVQPYLFFEGCCEQALAFYTRALGARIETAMHFRDCPEPAAGCADQPMPEGYEDKIMHCEFRIGDTLLLASDGLCGGSPDFQGFALTLVTTDKAEAEQKFSALCDGGEVQMPMAATFFSPAFGMVRDRFGILWNIYAAPAGQ